jgi:pyruvate/2-oxoglutarate dehydrogenase complex dihydrolipoamide acyltransferase (E2) component
MTTPTDVGKFILFQPSADRRFSMDAFAALPPSHLMVALLEIDVTDAQAAIQTLRAGGTRVSLFSFLVHAIAVAISEHPDMNLVLHGKKLVRFEDVDVSVPVEVTTPEGRFPREVVLRQAHKKSAPELFAELAAAREQNVQRGQLGEEDRWNRGTIRVLRWMPAALRISILRWFMASAFRIKRHAGTTAVTSIGKFASIPGFAFTFTTGPRAATFAIGSVVEKPCVHDRDIRARSILSLSIMVNHDLVDGGPAARFATRLQQLIQSAEGLK